MTYYLKYRSQSLEDLDSTEVRDSLKKIVASGNIPHAFLLTGPKGIGKTSAARILAKIVNCEKPKKNAEPCNVCEQCKSITRGDNLDVYELDAASHRGIDDIRQLRDGVKLAPTRANKKVYIIDEAHMLTTEALNALLKTLEEPPAHVIFILATTNPEKLIETIKSRTVIINFSKAKSEELVRALTRIVTQEKLKVDEKVLELIAKYADGSFREAVKTLELLVANEVELKEEFVSGFLFTRNVLDVNYLIDLIIKRDVKSLLSEVDKCVSTGVEVKIIIKVLLERFRSALRSKFAINGEDIGKLSRSELIQLIKLLNTANNGTSNSAIEEIPLELTFIEWCEDKIKDNETKTEPELKQNVKPDFRETLAGGKIKETENGKIAGEKVIENKVEVSSANGGKIENVWDEILFKVRPINASTEALLRAAKPLSFDGKKLTLGVYYKFHKERLESNPHRDILESTVAEIIGLPIRLECTLTEPPIKNKVIETIKTEPVTVTNTDSILTEAEDEEIIKIAKDIFGN